MGCAASGSARSHPSGVWRIEAGKSKKGAGPLAIDAVLPRHSAKDGRYISPSIERPNDGKRLGGRIINNQVGEHRPEFNRQRRQVPAKMSGLRVRSQQSEGFGKLLQYISGEASATSAYEIVSDFAEVLLGFWR